MLARNRISHYGDSLPRPKSSKQQQLPEELLQQQQPGQDPSNLLAVAAAASVAASVDPFLKSRQDLDEVVQAVTTQVGKNREIKLSDKLVEQ